MRKVGWLLFGLLLIGGVFFFWQHRSPDRVAIPVPVAEEKDSESPDATPSPTPAPTPVSIETSFSKAVVVIEPTPKPPIAVSMNVDGRIVSIAASKANPQEAPDSHEFFVEDGVAVVDSDMAVGSSTRTVLFGRARLPDVELWPTRKVPYYIQPNLENPARVQEAIAFFKSTSLQLVPWTGESDVLVFQAATGVCKSFVGKIGGKQPIWIAPNCRAREIAHEIMHAIGFAHEQNRSDRDKYIQINAENIDPKKIYNLDRMPEPFMQLSGLSDFSFDSIMLYPTWMYSRNGSATMSPIEPGKQIAPGPELSSADRDRINRYYGER